MEAATAARFVGIGSAMELAVMRDVGERVDVRPDVGTHHDQVVRGTAAVRANHVTMPSRQGVIVCWVIGRLWHTSEQGSTEIENPHPVSHGSQKWVRHRMTPCSLSSAISSGL